MPQPETDQTHSWVFIIESPIKWCHHIEIIFTLLTLCGVYNQLSFSKHLLIILVLMFEEHFSLFTYYFTEAINHQHLCISVDYLLTVFDSWSQFHADHAMKISSYELMIIKHMIAPVPVKGPWASIHWTDWLLTAISREVLKPWDWVL